MPDDMAAEQGAQWAKLEPRLALFLRAFLVLIDEKRAEHARRVGWLPPQAGYLSIYVPRVSRGRDRRAFVHVLIADRDSETGVPVAGLNQRVFCYIERETGDIYKLSQGKVMSGARGSIYDEASARRAVTPFGIESR